MNDSGVGGMVRTGAMLENDAGMMVLSIGRSATDDADSAMEICGMWLCFRVELRGPEILLAAARMDAADEWDVLLRAADTEAGWVTLRDVINALETHGIKSLERPIEAWDGFDGASGWVIA
jgi:hypothetical protein